MREIKFDAIYKPTGEHFIPITLDFNTNIVTGSFDRKANDWCFFSLDGKKGDVILREYTGLTDMNNVEIYEGDIVKGYYDEWDDYFEETNRHHFLSDVKYISNSFKVHRDTVNDEGRIRDYGYQHEWDNETIEVIGNIYENPELLSNPDTSKTQ